MVRSAFSGACRFLRACRVAALILIVCIAGPRAVASPYVTTYREDPVSLDYLRVWRRDSSPHIANFVDGLLEHDRFGILRPSLATAWTRNADATVWTFTIRPGVWWIDADRRPRAEVKARDWVDAMRYLLETGSPQADIAKNVILNADAYSRGAIVDFGEVGVRALGDLELRYTLERPTPWFDSLVTTAAFLPVNGEFLRQAGASFGAPVPAGILYNGAYILDGIERRSRIRYSANDRYWDAPRVTVPEAQFIFDDGADPDAGLRGFLAGELTELPLRNASATDTPWVIHSPQDASTFVISFNFLRDSQAAAERGNAAAALRDRSFRKALFFGTDRAAILDAMYGSGASGRLLRNTFTAPGVAADRRGMDYVSHVEAALKARNPDDFGRDFRVDDGSDPYFNPERARRYLQRARQSLSGTVVFPVELQAVMPEGSAIERAGLEALAASLERVFGEDAVRIALIAEADVNAAAIQAGVPWDARRGFDVGIHYGWRAEYGDPSSYLRSLPPGGASGAARAVGLTEFRRLVDAADGMYDDDTRRYRAFAAAEAQLLDDALLLPLQSLGGAPYATRVRPFGTPFAPYGLDAYKLKGMSISGTPLRPDEVASARRTWERERVLALFLNNGNRSRR